MDTTPETVITELRRIQTELSKGADAIYRAEIELADAEAEYDRIESLAFIEASGTISDRQAEARLRSSEAKLRRDIAKAAVNRVRTKIRSLESASVATSVIAKQVELMWKHA
jgi:hypothetical protein